MTAAEQKYVFLRSCARIRSRTRRLMVRVQLRVLSGEGIEGGADGYGAGSTKDGKVTVGDCRRT